MVKTTSIRGAIVTLDEQFSESFYQWYAQTGLSTAPLIALEFSGHGVPWLVFSLGTFLFKEDLSDAQRSTVAHLFVGLVTDLILIAVVKLIVRRKRPVHDSGKQLGSVEVIDKFSFPSGHCTRLMFVASFALGSYLKLRVGTPMTCVALTILANLVAVSRIALGRHYIGDVIAGTVLGVLNSALVFAIWQPIEKVDWVRSTILGKLAELPGLLKHA
ncbi:Phospholipid phosphatase 6 [Porphyridium purpureum]|uniref:Phospholipid phosphatase 6 n=1 Tax=Porphyridium purpureum TaxID=35688 RepID=A0A5J4YQJ6_PORPP|nr:Phospholipid phosphatase 6 [Porphyridium purpureum]|eukprot:POR8769..scf236_6